MIGLGSDDKSQSSYFWKLRGRVFQDGGGEATVVNLLGLSIVLFVVFVLAIVTRQSFRWSLIECHEKSSFSYIAWRLISFLRRLNMAEDQMLLTEGHTE